MTDDPRSIAAALRHAARFGATPEAWARLASRAADALDAQAHADDLAPMVDASEAIADHLSCPWPGCTQLGRLGNRRLHGKVLCAHHSAEAGDLAYEAQP